MSDTSQTPTVPGDQVALPGPHPHDSADFDKWQGCDSTEKRTPPGFVPPADTSEGELV